MAGIADDAAGERRPAAAQVDGHGVLEQEKSNKYLELGHGARSAATGVFRENDEELALFLQMRRCCNKEPDLLLLSSDGNTDSGDGFLLIHGKEH